MRERGMRERGMRERGMREEGGQGAATHHLVIVHLARDGGLGARGPIARGVDAVRHFLLELRCADGEAFGLFAQRAQLD